MSDDWSHRWEFLPPRGWRKLWSYMIKPFGPGVMLMWCPGHWAVGFEVWGWGASILLGPLAIGWGSLRESRP